MASGCEVYSSARWARSLVVIACMAVALMLNGCANYHAPFQTTPAHLGITSTANEALRALPAPRDPVVVAVYRFRDQTGQYKPSQVGTSFSTAVTQGATSILVRALEESGWFQPIEREGLSNLLNERQIIESIRLRYDGPDGQQLGPLPPLLYAGVLLEGGIIGYDTNVMTGGMGARYLGIGGSGQFRQDQVTIYLRAVSTQTGRVLKTVHTTKTILSQKLDGGVFRFVDVQQLLEGEVGYSFNEPPVLAVTEAIEEAVRALVIEGLRDNLWALADPGRQPALFRAYDEELARARRTDYFGRIVEPVGPGLALGLSAGAALYQGDYRAAAPGPGAAGFIRYDVSRRVGLGVSGQGGVLWAANRAYEELYVGSDVFLRYAFLPGSRIAPYAELGGGAMLLQRAAAGNENLFPYVRGEAGVEIRVLSELGVVVGLGNTYPLREGLDGVVMGGAVHDNVWNLRLGLTYRIPF